MRVRETLSAFGLLSTLLACSPSAQYQAAQVAAESAYTAELVQCVDKSETLAESKACRALVDARWGVTETVTTKVRPK
jgi:DNA-binding transcriptional regulator PaaX